MTNCRMMICRVASCFAAMPLGCTMHYDRMTAIFYVFLSSHAYWDHPTYGDGAISAA